MQGVRTHKQEKMKGASAELADALFQLSEKFRAAGDGTRARQMTELLKKAQEQKLTIAFCGHFSAGKSTLVNRLCGARLLPSSPIPTSANVVTIRSGEAGVRLVRQLADGTQQTEQASLAELDAYCKDGDAFAGVEIRYPIPLLGEDLVLLDTPGIDSTDDAHRMATESALHLADVVFYVMDYNHVQSEVNFAFARQLKAWGKPLYCIVNQIDKHREQELSFAAYKASVEEAFGNWDLTPAGMFYLSLREPAHPHQQWQELLAVLEALKPLREVLHRYSLECSASQLGQSHLAWLREQAAPQRERLVEQAGGEAQLAKLEGELALRTAELKEAQQAGEQLQVELRKALQALLANAQLMPAVTRDKAHAYLESRQPGFRMGLLFAGAKTAAEQARRTTAFVSDVQQQANAAISWHAKELFRAAAHRLGWRDEELEAQLNASFDEVIDEALLAGEIKAGAGFSNEATLNYCRSAAEAARSAYRERGMQWVEALAARASEQGQATAAAASAALKQLHDALPALTAIEQLDEAVAAAGRELTELLRPPALPHALPSTQAQMSGQALSKAHERTEQRTHEMTQTQVQAQRRGEARGREEELALAASARQQMETALSAYVKTEAAKRLRARDVTGAQGVRAAEQAAQQGAQGVREAEQPGLHAEGEALLGPQKQAAQLLEASAALLAPHAPLAADARAMRSKAERLAAQRFTIALFGAFSAGKSSFANALMGASALPVSPNPTTAAINRIVPPSQGQPHGMALIRMKTRAALLTDIRYSLALLGESVDGVEEAGLLALAGKVKPETLHSGGRPHYSFLKAVLQGWAQHEGKLGEQLHVQEEVYRRFVAEESWSCFVQEIELAYDCAMTRQGIVLVDTPGADSVNARHTDVAFNYIKNADAILFVTYYNHAFSQADRQFLLQLGRVKDQFELDKMFFIVNAADLAADEAELRGVLDHVESQLLQHGIRHPRMYPVSSLLALEAKEAGSSDQAINSGMMAFEQAFLAFTAGELGQLAVASAMQDLARAQHKVAAWRQAAASDASARAAQRAALAKELEEARGKADGLARRAVFDPVEQELQELLHHVLQRIRFRFGTHFQAAFNPAVLKEDGRDLKRVLWTCWLELQRVLQQELAEELLATTLRIGNAMNRLLTNAYGALAQELGQTLVGWSPAPLEQREFATPVLGDAWSTEAIERKLLTALFRSPRHFFEGNGKADVRKALEERLETPLHAYIDQIGERWLLHYRSDWQHAVKAAGRSLHSELEEYAQARAVTLTETVDPAQLGKLAEELERLATRQGLQ